jgi:hypothetical protein
MSTPISDIPTDVEGIDEGASYYPDPYVAPPQRVDNPRALGRRDGLWSRYKQQVILFVAILLAIRIPLDALHRAAPHQIFILGEAPLRASIAIGAAFAIQQLVGSLI